jgi:hypothetical protein
VLRIVFVFRIDYVTITLLAVGDYDFTTVRIPCEYTFLEYYEIVAMFSSQLGG